jgi:predicted dehydrogenase
MIRVGVVGTGVFGYHHTRVLAGFDGAQFVGIHDQNGSRANEVAGQFGVQAHPTLEALLDACDALVVAVPTVHHQAVVLKAADAGKHVLVEKPIAFSMDEARRMAQAFKAKGLVLAVGHIERHNPAVEAVLPLVKDPRYITVERLAVFTPRSLDVDVILDLMIHDIQIVQDLARSEVREVRASGVPVLSSKVDIANARLEFDNGVVANLTASRISLERIRKLRIFEPRAYFSVDYADKSIKAFALETAGGAPRVEERKVEVRQQEPLRAELADFVGAIEGKRPPCVDGDKGGRALDVACRIQDALR